MSLQSFFAAFPVPVLPRTGCTKQFLCLNGNESPFQQDAPNLAEAKCTSILKKHGYHVNLSVK